MKLNLHALFALCATAVFSAQVWAWSPEIGEVPKEIQTYEYVDGTPIVWAALKGKPSIVYFGGDWCPPCAQTRPTIVKIAQTKADTINVVFVSSDDNKLRAKKIEEASAGGLRIAMPKLANHPTGAAVKGRGNMGEYGRIYVWPTAVLLDKEGRVVRKYERGTSILNSIEADASKLQ